jgi:diguanylate cyclase
MGTAKAPWFALPVIPAGGICALAFAAAALDPRGTNWTILGAAAGVSVAAVASATLVPWPRLPTTALVVVPVSCDLVLGLLREAQGGSSSGYGPLAILPVVWVGLLLGRRAITVITMCTALLFGLPIAIVGGPAYPDSGWRGTALWTVVAALVAVGGNRIMVDQRRLTTLADTRATELDRLVATQAAIATSSFDLETVLTTVVTEAQRLSGADAAVVELPEGDDLVYRAVAGNAEPHLGLRLPRAGTVSGLALETQTTRLCRDAELDGHVDREACRLVGARSLLVVPLLHEGSATGVLKVYSGSPEAFIEEHAKVLSLLANMIGSALARAELIDRLSEQAVTDELTGLPNRRAWSEQLALSLGRCRRSGQALSVVLLDLDGFKQVNDRQGHAAGDRVLRAVTRRWSAALRETDVLGRIGGDEFAVVLEGADEAAAVDVVRRLEVALAGSHRASAGVATWDGVEDEAALLARADADMYEQKRGRSLVLAPPAGGDSIGMSHGS